VSMPSYGLGFTWRALSSCAAPTALDSASVSSSMLGTAFLIFSNELLRDDIGSGDEHACPSLRSPLLEEAVERRCAADVSVGNRC